MKFVSRATKQSSSREGVKMEEWDLNSPERVKIELSLQELVNESNSFSPQAESAPHIGVDPAEVAYSSEYPDGKLPYA